jgi:hypothetical protein
MDADRSSGTGGLGYLDSVLVGKGVPGVPPRGGGWGCKCRSGGRDCRARESWGLYKAVDK